MGRGYYPLAIRGRKHLEAPGPHTPTHGGDPKEMRSNICNTCTREILVQPVLYGGTSYVNSSNYFTTRPIIFFRPDYYNII